MSTIAIKLITVLGVFLGVFVFGLWFDVPATEAAALRMSPASGSFTVGSTFDVSVLVDTAGESVNTVQMNLLFPADRLQLISPSTGKSIIGIYTAPPKFDNKAGTVEIVGGVPNGIVTGGGLVTTLTFKVTGVGPASLRFGSQSQVLLNDGQGTEVLQDTSGATFQLNLPPQQGPQVFSDSFPSPDSWSKDEEITLVWDVGLPPADGYSYTLSNDPASTPDDVINSKETSVTYTDLAEGQYFFHIKSLRDGEWSGISRFSVKVDGTPPGEFEIDISPSDRTRETSPVVRFNASDSASGIDKYQIKIIPLKVEGRSVAQTGGQLFIDAESPYVVPELLYGSYEVIVRAYDNAGNFRDVTKRLEITSSPLSILGLNGLYLPFNIVISWTVLWILFALVILALIVLAFFARRWYVHYRDLATAEQYPQNLQSQLKELQQYRSKYGKMAVIVLLGLFGWIVVQAPSAHADVVGPPVIDTYSQTIKTDELFYISGRTPKPESDVVIRLQSLVDGTSFDFTTTSNELADWTYRHNGFLQGGEYILWAQTKDGEELSVPSPQVTMDVQPVAISWGGSRITYQAIYLTVIAGLLLIALALFVYIVTHAIFVIKRRRQFAHQLRQAEDSIRRGFMALREDIESELSLIKQAHLSDELSGEQKVRETQLRKDLDNIERLVGKEIWQVESFEKLTHG